MGLQKGNPGDILMAMARTVPRVYPLYRCEYIPNGRLRTEIRYHESTTRAYALGLMGLGEPLCVYEISWGRKRQKTRLAGMITSYF